MIKTACIVIQIILHRLFALELRVDHLHVVSIEEAPYLTLVLCNNSKSFCSGTLVHQKYVLTAAHCFYDVDGKVTEDDTTVYVVSGTNKLSLAEKEINSGLAQIRQSLKLRVYDSYHFSENFLDDVALIELDGEFEITKRTQIAPLGPREETKVTQEPTPPSSTTPKDGPHTHPWIVHDPYMDQFPHLTTREPLLVVEEEKAKDSLDYQCFLYGFGTVELYDENANDNALKKQAIVVGLCTGDSGAPLICEDYLRGIGANILHFSDRDACKLKDSPNECGDRLTMSLFMDLCHYSQWLGWWVPDYLPVSDSCSPYQARKRKIL